MRNVCTHGVAMALAALTMAGASGQNYPARPIRLVTSEAGGGTDFESRLIAQGVSPALGQQIVVENRPSALTGETVANAAPDGYTLLLNGTGFWLAPLLQSTPAYDAAKDFAPITLVSTAPLALVVHASVPAKSVRELIALAKSKPGQLNYGSSAPGTPSHLAAEMLKSMAGVNIERIPYRGAGPAITALVAGQVELFFGGPDAVDPHIKAGRLRALAVTSPKRSPLVPGLPAVAEVLPGYDVQLTYGMFAPAATPAAIVSKLNQEIVAFLKKPETKERFLKSGAEAVGSSPEQLGALVKADLLKWGKLIKQIGVPKN